MAAYDHEKIEKKWQKRWEESGAFRVEENSTKEKNYVMIEFPYPSGDGLHVGHVRSWTAMDVVARKRRAEGKNVLYPIGWDAFGLPTENYAIKTGRNPKEVTEENTGNFRRQIKSLGLSFDWSREINTTDPSYYKWTQWIFLKFFEKGLAYKAKTLINWCPKDKIGLANEEVVDGTCERCGTPVEKREKEQWMLAITKYAKRLYDDLDLVDYIDAARVQQRNWIGPSEGAEIDFGTTAGEKIKIFTTRPDTLFGATYMVLAPEHPQLNSLLANATNKDEVLAYAQAAKNKSEIERTAEGKEKTGVEIKGVMAINPATKEEIPLFVADYVLAGYGTGAIMAVPAHDERDFAFAKKFNLSVKDKPLVDAKEIVKKVGGEWKTNFKLRDWVFSRQRYWGEPIPMIYCEKDGWVPVPEKDLPVMLPEVEKYLPTDTGESPLAAMSEWVNTTCRTCGGPAKRETDVMPNWAGSSWYWLRYTDPQNSKEFASKEKLNYWTPVDWYNGGMEHTVLHLLYSRFWHKFLYDLKLVPTPEPYMKRTSHGLILAEDGSKMSKSKGNTVSPDEIVKTFGADSLRLYEMFIGPFDQPVSWSTNSILGVRRFLERVWKLGEASGSASASTSSATSTSDGQSEAKEPRRGLHSATARGLSDFSAEKSRTPEGLLSRSDSLEVLLNQTIKKVGEDIENLKMNTAVSSLMVLLNALEKEKAVSREQFEIFLQLLFPFAPHIASELWSELGNKETIESRPWPRYNEDKLAEKMATVAVQVNGKVRGIINIASDAMQEEAIEAAYAQEALKKWLPPAPLQEAQGGVKVIYVPGRILSFVAT